MSSVEQLVIESLAEENLRLDAAVVSLTQDVTAMREVLSVALEHLKVLTDRCRSLTRQVQQLMGEPVDVEARTPLAPWYPPVDSPPLPEGMVTADQIRWEME